MAGRVVPSSATGQRASLMGGALVKSHVSIFDLPPRRRSGARRSSSCFPQPGRLRMRLFNVATIGIASACPGPGRLRQEAAAADAAAHGRLCGPADRAGDPDHRTAGPGFGDGVVRCAPPGQRRRSSRRDFAEGSLVHAGPGSLRDRGFALSRRLAERPGPTRPGPGQHPLHPASGRPLSQAGGDRRGQQAGRRQRPGGGGTGQGRRGRGRGAVAAAQVNLGFTQIRAPISGRIGRSLFTPGALVQAGQTEALATIQRMDQVYVDVTQSAAALLDLRAAMRGGDVSQPAPDTASVQLILPNGAVYPIAGVLRFADVTVDPTTGAVVVRATFPNPDGVLLAGPVCPRAPDRGRAQGRPAGAADRRHAQRAWRGRRPGGRPRQCRGAADGQDRPGDRRQMAGHRRAWRPATS